MRHEFTARIKDAAALRANGHCEACTRRLSAGDYHYDHIIPDAIGGEATLDNCQVLCTSCHKLKTGSSDAPRIAKAKRNYRKSKGIRKRSRFACSREGRFKKKLDGTVVRR